MRDKSIGARGVKEVAEVMGVNKTRVNFLTNNMLRKLRWPNRLRAVKRLVDEYSRQAT